MLLCARQNDKQMNKQIVLNVKWTCKLFFKAIFSFLQSHFSNCNTIFLDDFLAEHMGSHGIILQKCACIN
jgi:hypothetical protein